MSEPQSPPDEPFDPLSELLELTAALGAHLEAVKNSGALGLPPASPEAWQALERSYPVALAPLPESGREARPRSASPGGAGSLRAKSSVTAASSASTPVAANGRMATPAQSAMQGRGGQ